MLSIVNDELQPCDARALLTLVAMAEKRDKFKDRLSEAMGKTVTPAALARACKTSRAAVSKWMSGDTKDVKMAHLFLIADTCRVDARWLATGEGEPHPPPNGRGPMTPQDRADRAFMQAFRALPWDWRFNIGNIVSELYCAKDEDHGKFVRRATIATSKMLEEFGIGTEQD